MLMHGDLGYSTSGKDEPPCMTAVHATWKYPGTQSVGQLRRSLFVTYRAIWHYLVRMGTKGRVVQELVPGRSKTYLRFLLTVLSNILYFRPLIGVTKEYHLRTSKKESSISFADDQMAILAIAVRKNIPTGYNGLSILPRSTR